MPSSLWPGRHVATVGRTGACDPQNEPVASPLLACQLPVGTIGDTIGPMVDPSARPVWKRTGYKFFPYAAQQSASGGCCVSVVDTNYHDNTRLTLPVTTITTTTSA